MAVYGRLIDHEDFSIKCFDPFLRSETKLFIALVGSNFLTLIIQKGLQVKLEQQEDRRMAMLLLHLCAHEEAFYWKDVTMNAVPLTSIPSS